MLLYILYQPFIKGEKRKMPSLAEMASKGARKLTAKTPTMSANYESAKGRMKTNFGAMPFGPNTKAAYNAGVDAGHYRTPDVGKWQRNWEAAMQR
jgi:hypothetical protein